MAWQFIGVSSVVEVATTSHALVTTGITGLAAGDLLVACISSRIASTTSITLPTGGAWTLVAEQKNNNILSTSSAFPSGLMAYCIRGASNPNLTFTHPTAPSVALGRIVAYRDVNQGSPKDTQTAFQTAINITAVSGTGLTTTLANDLIVAMACGGQEAAWSAFNATSPAGASGATSTAAPTTAWLERADSLTTTGADTSLAIFDAIKSAAGATGNLTATASVAAGHVVIAGAFKIASAAATGAGALAADAAAVSGSGSVETVPTTGSGAAQAGAAVVAGLGVSSSTAVIELELVDTDGAFLVDTDGALLVDTLEFAGLAAGAATASGSGASIWAGIGTAVAQAADADGVGVSSWLATGAAVAQSSTVSGTGRSVSTGTGALSAQAAVVSGTGRSASVASGALAAGTATTAGTGVSRSAGSGVLIAAVAAANGVGVSSSIGSGALAAQAAVIGGTGVSSSVGTGALVAQAATVAGTIELVEVEGITGSGALAAAAAGVSGTGEVAGTITGTGALVAAAAVVAGPGVSGSTAVIEVGLIDTDGAVLVDADGALLVDTLELAELAAGAATASGTGASVSSGAVALAAGAAIIAGAGVVVEEGVALGTGALVADAATVAGEGEVTGEVVQPPVGGAGGYYRPPRPYLVEGYGYGILPALEGEAHGVVVAAGAGTLRGLPGLPGLPGLSGTADGSIGVAGCGTARLGIVKAAAVGVCGQIGTAAAALECLKSSGSGAVGSRGSGAGVLVTIKGAGRGRHDDDEAAIVAWLLAA